ALALAALLEEAQKTFAVRIGEEVRRSSPSALPHLIEISGDREKTLGAEEPAVGDLGQPTGAQRLGEFAAHCLDRIGVIDRHISLAAASLVESDQPGDPLQQGGFAGAVLADDDGDGSIEAELEFVPQKRKAERVGVGIGNARSVDPDAPEVGRGQVDRALASSAHAEPSWFQPDGGCRIYSRFLNRIGSGLKGISEP